MRFGYALVVVTMLLMIWSSLAGAREIVVNKNDPTCGFSPMCTCSSTGVSLGIVQCQNSPFPAIPRTVNSSKVSSMQSIGTHTQALPTLRNNIYLLHLKLGIRTAHDKYWPQRGRFAVF